MKLQSKIKRQASRAVHKVLAPTHFDAIPLEPIFDALAAHGIDVVQEDGTAWSGFLCGAASETSFDLHVDGEPVENAALRLQWYTMGSGRVEVIGYLS